MGMANGESGIYFGTNVGKWGAKGTGKFFGGGLPKGDKIFLYTMCLYSKCSDFCGEFKCGCYY